MRFLSLTAVVALSVALLCPEVSAQAPGTRLRNKANGQFISARDDDGAPDNVRRPVNVDDGVEALLRGRTIGNSHSMTAAERRALYSQRSAARREAAAANKADKEAFEVDQRQRQTDYVAGQKAARAQSDAEFQSYIKRFPQAGQEVMTQLRTLKLDTIPAQKERIRVSADRVAQWTQQIKSFDPKTVVPDGSGFASVDMYKRITLGKNRVGEDKSESLGRSDMSTKLSVTQRLDDENLMIMDQTRKTTDDKYMLVVDTYTGTVMPVQESFRSRLDKPDPSVNSQKNRYKLWNGKDAENGANSPILIGYAELPKYIESGVRNLAVHERNRFQSRLTDATTELNGRKSQLATLEATRNDLQTKADLVEKFTPDRRANPLNPLQQKVGQEFELDSADFLNSPSEYFHKQRSVVVNVEVDA